MATHPANISHNALEEKKADKQVDPWGLQVLPYKWKSFALYIWKIFPFFLTSFFSAWILHHHCYWYIVKIGIILYYKPDFMLVCPFNCRQETNTWVVAQKKSITVTVNRAENQKTNTKMSYLFTQNASCHSWRPSRACMRYLVIGQNKMRQDKISQAGKFLFQQQVAIEHRATDE